MFSLAATQLPSSACKWVFQDKAERQNLQQSCVISLTLKRANWFYQSIIIFQYSVFINALRHLSLSTLTHTQAPFLPCPLSIKLVIVLASPASSFTLPLTPFLSASERVLYKESMYSCGVIGGCRKVSLASLWVTGSLVFLVLKESVSVLLVPVFFKATLLLIFWTFGVTVLTPEGLLGRCPTLPSVAAVFEGTFFESSFLASRAPAWTALLLVLAFEVPALYPWLAVLSVPARAGWFLSFPSGFKKPSLDPGLPWPASELLSTPGTRSRDSQVKCQSSKVRKCRIFILWSSSECH